MGTTTTDVIHESSTGWDDNEEGGTAEDIKARIEHTRTELSHTIDAIQDKLSPEHIKARAAEKLHDVTLGTAKRAAQKVVDTVAELTPQPRHDNPHYPYGDPEAARQQCLEKGKALLRRNQKLLAAGAGALVFAGLVLKVTARRRLSLG
jgi:hypothetical protein